MSEHSFWIYLNRPQAVNEYAMFSKKFMFAENTRILLSADYRYWLYINGRFVGSGPERNFKKYYTYDEYDLVPYLLPGENCVCVIVNAISESTFQSFGGTGAFRAEILGDGLAVYTDEHWKGKILQAYCSNVPRISAQQAFEEQFDARLFDGFSYESFLNEAEDCRVVQTECNLIGKRYVPYLTQQEIYPVRLVETQRITETPQIISFDFRRALKFENRFTASPFYMNGEFEVVLTADRSCEFKLADTPFVEAKVNGLHGKKGILHAGRNTISFPFKSVCFITCRTLAVYTEAKITVDRISMRTFRLDREKGKLPLSNWGFVNYIDYESEQDITYTLHKENIFALTYYEKAEACKPFFTGEENFLSGSGYVKLDTGGKDVRFLLDFGGEKIAKIKLDAFCEGGEILDFHCFEFVQADGRKNFAEGMNNTMRYICRRGRNEYTSLIRHGMRYLYVTVRNAKTVYLRVWAEESTHPFVNRGEFLCDDYLLNEIYRAGIRTLRCCSEDTYTDCPTYEQVHWVGDMRNEALCDYAVNGDARLWKHCLVQVGQSLDYSPITQSQVPSAWYNIIPAWSFLWMRSVAEYLAYTGDRESAAELFSFVERNLNGIEQHINADGLFEIEAWNLFDWAKMDIPPYGVVTHQNCLLIIALQSLKGQAQKYRPDLSLRLEKLEERLKAGINRFLYNEQRRAYVDCLRYEGGKRIQSNVISQQTNTVAVLSGVATGERAEAAQAIMRGLDADSVKAGSPFFEFFMLEALDNAGDTDAFLQEIRKNWGFMLDCGCDVFWEMWTNRDGKGRLTRSHCHGWSAAPVYYLTKHILGIVPIDSEKGIYRFEPHLGKLKWARGKVPTKFGDICVNLYSERGKVKGEIKKPDRIKIMYQEET